MLPSGTQTTFVNRCHWAATYMTKAGLLDRPKRAHIAITQRGIDLLATKPDKVNIAALSQYPEFEAFRKKRPTGGTDTTQGNDEENPEESLFRAYGSWRQTIEADLLERLQSASFPWQSFETSSWTCCTPWATAAGTRTASGSPRCPAMTASTGSSTRTAWASMRSTSRPRTTRRPQGRKASPPGVRWEPRRAACVEGRLHHHVLVLSRGQGVRQPHPSAHRPHRRADSCQVHVRLRHRREVQAVARREGRGRGLLRG